MNKQEFLTELRQKLAGLPKDDLENRLNFYAEMIDDRVEEGKSEEEAIQELGSVDAIVEEIAKDTSLVTLVKEKVKPKREIKVWEIVLLTLGFPLWFPVVLTAVFLAALGYLFVWIAVIVSFSIEFSLVWTTFASLINFFASGFNWLYLGTAFLSAGGAILLFFVCVYVAKFTWKLSKLLITKIKALFIKKGNN